MKHLFALLVFIVTPIFASAQFATLVYDFNPGAAHGTPGPMSILNGKAYFTAYNPTSGFELWKYSGTGNPTLAFDFNPGSGDGVARVVAFRNKVYFTGYTSGAGWELMAYDGVNPPTLVADLLPGLAGSFPEEYMESNGKLYFKASTNTGASMYVYDGVNPPVSLAAFPAGSGAHGFTPFGGKIIYIGSDAVVGNELFSVDTGSGAVAVFADVDTGSAGSYPRGMTVLNGKLYFTASTVAKGYELYSHDGNLFTRLTDLAPGSGSGVNSAPVVYNNMIYFAGDTTVGKSQLYSYDPATAALFKWGIGNRNLVSLSSFAIHQNNLFFAVADTALAVSFWAHDGFNTARVFEIDTAKPGGYPSGFDVFNNALFIRGQSVAAGRELFVYGSPVAVPNNSMGNMVQVLPNPTSGNAVLKLTLTQTQVIGITLADVGGKTVWKSTPTTYVAGENSVMLPLSKMVSGMYFYNVIGTAGRSLVAGRVVKD